MSNDSLTRRLWRLWRSKLGPASQKGVAGLLSQAQGRGGAIKAIQRGEYAEERGRRKQSPQWYGSQPGEVPIEVSDRKIIPESETETAETESQGWRRRGRFTLKKSEQ